MYIFNAPNQASHAVQSTQTSSISNPTLTEYLPDEFEILKAIGPRA